MDLGEMLPQLEGLADKIHVPGFDFHALINDMWDIYHKTVMVIPPAEPVRELGRKYQAHADRLDTLITEFEGHLGTLGQVYQGSASDAYYEAATNALRHMQKSRAYLTRMVTHHMRLASLLDTACGYQMQLIVLAGILVGDFIATLATAGADAEVTVPVAAGDIAGGIATGAELDATLTAADSEVMASTEEDADLDAEQEMEQEAEQQSEQQEEQEAAQEVGQQVRDAELAGELYASAQAQGWFNITPMDALALIEADPDLTYDGYMAMLKALYIERVTEQLHNDGLTDSEIDQLLQSATPGDIKALLESTATGVQPQDVPYLRSQGYTGDQIVELLRNWQKFSSGVYVKPDGTLPIDPLTGKPYPADTIREWLDTAEGRGSNKAAGGILGARRELYVLMKVGADNVAALGVTFAYMKPNSDGTQTKSGGETELILNNGDIVEVGGGSKGASLPNQHNKYVYFLKATGGHTIWVYLDDKGHPSSAFNRAVRTAEGFGDVKVEIFSLPS